MYPPIARRILMSTDTVGGVWMYAVELARALRQHGVQVVLATMGGAPTDGQRAEARRIPDLILCESRFRLEWMTAPWADVDRAGRWLRQLERRYQPDLVHLNHYSHGHLDWHAPCLLVGHSCVLSWWRAVRGEAAPSEWETYRERVRGGLRGADAVVAPSHAMLDALHEEYDVLPRASVVHNGRTPGEYRRLQKRPYILAAGRLWDGAKNLEALARVAAALPWPVHLAGEACHPDGGGAVLDDVHTLGHLAPESLRRWYGHASIYVLPARYEPFGLSVLEAALAGCAPVLGDIPSLRELWDGAARFVPADDPEMLRCAITELAEDHRARAALARRARRRALQYTVRRMAREYLAIHDKLLAQRGVSEDPVAASG